MSYKLQQEDGFTVIGISARVLNAEPRHIGNLWREFYARGGAASHLGRLDDAVCCVYCEYQGDWTQPYTIVIGCAFAPDATVPKGMKQVTVPAGPFVVLQAAGELPQAVIAAWSKVWATPLDRRYQADYDLYAADGAVSIHVGVR